MRSHTFTIPGVPKGKGRPRFSRRSGRAYTPAATEAHEATVSTIALAAIPEPLSGPVKVSIFATFEPAKSWSKKRRADALGRHHTQKPDTDNLVKIILDALNRIAFADDAQVAEVYCCKVWGTTARTVVTVEEVGPMRP